MTARDPAADFTLSWAGAYAYLLGLYLGDGCLSKHPRGVYRLRITPDSRHVGIAAECAQAMRTVMPANRVNTVVRRDQRSQEVHAYSKRWPDLFPQHGAGPTDDGSP